MDVRRVVTGHDAHGKAVIVDDGVVEPTTVRSAPPSITNSGAQTQVPRSPTPASTAPRRPSSPR